MHDVTCDAAQRRLCQQKSSPAPDWRLMLQIKGVWQGGIRSPDPLPSASSILPFCRWLLLSLDRLPANTLQMTQELISNMLGVRRQGVTESAGKLEREGLITYSRGTITVLDRAGLEERACECYRVVKRETERLLPQPAPR